MSDIAIQVEGLSKQFHIGRQQQSRTFREVLNDAVAMPLKRIGGLLRGNAAAAANLTETIWALKDVSFRVTKGEVIGIIGRNGAGKSTLLKVLSQITEPTEGRVKLYGRVGALLEIGTGFHTELTGRENIYLNGAILGMSREEIRRKFDEIVAFAEVEKFIDTPVKHYSSGMGLRLGFAVAAHLEPEILIVDEVLAVGDAAFQRKCLGKMGDVAGEGRTVLFVSHNMAAVQGLCPSAIVLDGGKIIYEGNVDSAIARYLTSNRFNSQANRTFTDHVDGLSRLNRTSVIANVRVITDSEMETNTILLGESVTFELILDPGERVFDNCTVAVGIFNLFGQLILPFRSQIQYANSWSLKSCKYVRFLWEECSISPGNYSVSVAFTSNGKAIERVDNALEIDVQVGRDFYGTGKDIQLLGGIIVPKVTISVQDR